MSLTPNEQKALGILKGGGSTTSYTGSNLSANEQKALQALFPQQTTPAPTVQPKQNNGIRSSVGSVVNNIFGVNKPTEKPLPLKSQKVGLLDASDTPMAAQSARQPITQEGLDRQQKEVDLGMKIVKTIQDVKQLAANVVKATVKKANEVSNLAEDKLKENKPLYNAATSAWDTFYNNLLISPVDRAVSNTDILKNAPKNIFTDFIKKDVRVKEQLGKALIQGVGQVGFGWHDRISAAIDKEIKLAKDTGDENINTVGRAIGHLATIMAPAGILSETKFAAEALPLIFTALGQTSLPSDTPGEQRIKTGLIDMTTGHLLNFLKVPENIYSLRDLSKFGMVKTSEVSLLSAQIYADARALGATHEEATKQAQDALTFNLMLAGALSLLPMKRALLDERIKAGATTMSPEEAIKMADAEPYKDTPLADMLRMKAAQAQQEGKMVDVMQVAKKSPLWKDALGIDKSGENRFTINVVEKRDSLAVKQEPSTKGTETKEPAVPLTPEEEFKLKAGMRKETEEKNITKLPREEGVEAEEARKLVRVRQDNEWKSEGDKQSTMDLIEHPIAYRDAYLKEYGNVLNPDLGRKLAKGYNGLVAHEYNNFGTSLVKIVKDYLFKNPKAGHNDTVLFTAGGPGSTKSTTLMEHPKKERDAYLAIIDSTFAPNSSVREVGKLLKNGHKVEIDYTLADPFASWKRAMARLTDNKSVDYQRVVSEGYFLDAHIEARDNVIEAYDKFNTSNNFDVNFYEKLGDNPETKDSSIDFVKNFNYNVAELRKQIYEYTDKLKQSGKISEEAYRQVTKDREAEGVSQSVRSSAEQSTETTPVKPEESSKAGKWIDNTDKGNIPGESPEMIFIDKNGDRIAALYQHPTELNKNGLAAWYIQRLDGTYLYNSKAGTAIFDTPEDAKSAFIGKEYSQTENKPENTKEQQYKEAESTVNDAIISGDLEAAQALHKGFYEADGIKLPDFDEMLARIYDAHNEILTSAEDEINKAREEGNPDDSTNKILDIAEQIKSNLLALTGKERSLQTDFGSFQLGGKATDIYDRLVFGTDIEGFSKNIKILHLTLDKVFTELYNTIKDGGIDGADYERFKREIESYKEQSKPTKRTAGGTVSKSSAGQVKPETPKPGAETPKPPEVNYIQKTADELEKDRKEYPPLTEEETQQAIQEGLKGMLLGHVVNRDKRMAEIIKLPHDKALKALKEEMGTYEGQSLDNGWVNYSSGKLTIEDHNFKPIKTFTIPQLLDEATKLLTQPELPETKYEYQSTQLDMPQTEAEKVVTFANNIPDEDLAKDPTDNYKAAQTGREDDPHVTVLYGLDNKLTADQLRTALKDTPPIEITLGKTSLFNNEKNDVLKVDVESLQLQALNEQLRKEFPTPGQTFSDYKPHMTIAYLKKGAGMKYVNDTTFEGKKITLHDLQFSTNTGEKVSIPLKTDVANQSFYDTTDISPAGRIKTASVDKVFNRIPDGATSSDGYIVKQGDKLFPTAKATPEILKNSMIDLNPDGSIKEGFMLNRMGFVENVALKQPRVAQESISDTNPLVGVENDIPEMTAIAAFNWTSFDPEKRGRSNINEYIRVLKSDYEDLLKLADTPEKKQILDEMFTKYRQGARERELKYLNSHSRVASSGITGGSNFPVEKNRRLGNIADANMKETINYRDYMLRKIKNTLNPTIIKGNDAQAVEKLQEKLTKLQEMQTKMVEANKIIRKGENVEEGLRTLGFDDAQIKEISTPGFMGRTGFMSYQLQNNNAKIKDTEARIQRLTKQKEAGLKETPFNGGKIVENPEADRLQIFFDAIPDETMRDKLKSNGFRWSPKNQAWQRQLTNNARYAVKHFLQLQPVEKQPWQMTSQEWDNEFSKTQVNFSGTGGEMAGIGRGTVNFNSGQPRQNFLKMGLHDTVINGMQIPARHKQVIKEALRQGLPVPQNVLAEYPDLQQAEPTYSGGSAGQSVGEYAQLPVMTKEETANEPRPEHDFDTGNPMIVPFPEMVRLAKALTGAYPKIKKSLGMSMGDAQEQTLRIRLLASLFKEGKVDQAQKVLSHEIGHIADYLPEGLRRRGNILGRIASLNGYTKHLLQEFPGDTEKLLTPEDRQRIRREAEQLSKKAVIEETEEVVGFEAVTPEDIKAIWNDFTSGEYDKELLTYIKTLSDEQKKILAVAAMKNKVPAWVEFKRKITRTVTREVLHNAPEDIRQLYRKLLKEEILKRRLYELKTIRAELYSLSKEWRPFVERFSTPDYIKYRKSASELYADAISVLFNDPARLEQKAPSFWKAFFNYLGEKPEVKEAFFDTYDLLHQSDDEIQMARLNDIYTGFEDARKKRAEIDEIKPLKRSFMERFMQQHVTRFDPIYRKLDKVTTEQGIEVSPKQKVRMQLEEMMMRKNESYLLLNKVVNDVIKPVEALGMSEDDLGALLMLERNLGDRKDIANPYGLQGQYSVETLAYLKKFLQEKKGITDEQFDILQQAARKLREINFDKVTQAAQAGIYSQEFYNETALPNKDTYVTYQVVDYIHQNYVSAGIKHATGTLSQVENPLVSTVLKTIAITEQIELQKGKLAVVDSLKEFFPDDVTDAEPVRIRGVQIDWKKVQDREVLELYRDGKKVGYNVDPYIAKMFDLYNGEEAHTIVEVSRAFNNIFKQLVTTYNISWGFYSNVKRDISRTYRNLATILPTIGDKRGLSIAEFVATWLSSIPESAKFQTGNLTQTLTDMLQNKAFSTSFIDYNPNANEESGLAPMLKKYRFLNVNKPSDKLKAIRTVTWPVRKTLEAIRFAGSTLETNTKIAGYQIVSKRTQNAQQKGFIVRNYVGTPNIMEGGLMKQTDNNIFVFSNIAAQGMRTDAELATDPKTRSGFWMRMFLLDILPKLAMLAAASGLLGAKVKGMMDDIGEYEKTNFITIPLGESENGHTQYWSIPQDDTARAFSALTWKLGSALAGQMIKPEQLPQTLLGYLPQETPLWSLASAWLGYVQGKNPYDDYRGRYVIDETTFRAGGLPALSKMVQWTINSAGFTAYSYQPGYAQDTTTEVILKNIPLLNRIIKSTDYGLTERENAEKKGNLQERSQETLRKRDLLKQYAELAKNKDNVQYMAYRQQFIEQVMGKGPYTSDQKARVSKLKTEFKLATLYGEVSHELDTLINDDFNDDKVDHLRMYKTQMGPDEYKQLIITARQNKIISDDLKKRLKKENLYY